MSTAVELIAKLTTQGAGTFTADIEKAKGAVEKLASEGLNNMKLIGGIAFGAVAAGATAMAGGIAVAVGRAAEFEQAMSKVGAISLASASDLDMLRDAALQAGSTTAFTATQAADGLSFLAMAGFSVEESIEALPAVLAAAAAGNLDLATTADIVSNVLGGMRMEASEAARVSDVLALASSKSNTNIEMLGQTMKFAAPTAANLGDSLEEVTAAAGFLADAGIQSSLAGTHLRAILGSLATPSKAASDALAGLGVEVRNTDGTMKNMSTIIRDLDTALGDVGPAQKDFALNAIFGREAAGSFSILLGRGADALDEYTDALENAGGAAQTMADMQLNNFNGAMTLLKSAVDGAMVSIGSRFLPVLTTLAQKAIPLIEKAMERVLPVLDRMIDLFMEAVSWLGVDNWRAVTRIGEMILTAFGASEETIVKFRKAVLSASKAVEKVKEVVAPVIAKVVEFLSANVKLSDVLTTVGIAMAIFAGTAIKGLIIAISPLLITFGLMVAAIALVRTAWENDLGGIQGKVETFKEKVNEAITAVKAWWEENGEDIINAAKQRWYEMKEKIVEAVEIIQEKANTVIETVREWWEENGDAIWASAQEIWGWVSDFISETFDNIMGFLDAFKLLFQGDWRGFLIKVWEVAGSQLDNVAKLFGQLWSGGESFEGVHPKLVRFFASIDAWFNEIDWKKLGLAVVNGVVEMVQFLWQGNERFGGVSGLLADFWTSISTWFSGISWEDLGYKITTAIIDTVKNMWAGSEGVGEGVLDKMTQFFNSIDEWFRTVNWAQLGVNLIQGIINGINSMRDYFFGIGAGLANGIRDAFKNALGMQSPSRLLFEDTKVGFSAIPSAILATLPSIKSAMGQVTDAMQEEFVPAFMPTWGGDTMTGALPFESVSAMQHETRIIVEVRGEHTNTEAHSGAFAGVQAAQQQAGLQADIRRRY
jgi:TP901 family phage tail tape measure protein